MLVLLIESALLLPTSIYNEDAFFIFVLKKFVENFFVPLSLLCVFLFHSFSDRFQIFRVVTHSR